MADIIISSIRLVVYCTRFHVVVSTLHRCGSLDIEVTISQIVPYRELVYDVCIRMPLHSFSLF